MGDCELQDHNLVTGFEPIIADPYLTTVKRPLWFLRRNIIRRLVNPAVAGHEAEFAVDHEQPLRYNELESEKHVLPELLKEPNQGFYDVGANIGLYSCIILIAELHAALVAIELSPPVYDKLAEASL